MKTVNIAVCNLAKTPLGVDIHRMVQACQRQVSEHFAPSWGVDANLFLVDGYTDDYWIILILDDADQANALGYHEVTAKGHPIGKVFVRAVVQAREQVSVTFSHELLEMLGDPDIQQVKPGPKGGYAYEACDACQSQSYAIDGVAVSNFVTPAWFGGTGKFDYLGKLTKPWQIGKGGYMPVQVNGQWTQIFGSAEAQQNYEARDHSRVPRILFGQFRRFTVNEAMMQSHPVFAMGFSWEALKGAVAKYGPSVLDAAAALSHHGFSVPWVTETLQKLVDLHNAPATASLTPGVQTSLGGVLGGILQNLLQNFLQNVNWQDLIQKIIQALTSSIGTPAPTKAADLPVAAN